MIKKIVFSIAFLIAVKIAVFLFIGNKQESNIDQVALNEIVLETSKLSKKEQEAILNEPSKKNSKLSQNELESLVLAQNKIYPKTGSNGVRIDRLSSGINLITYHKTFVNHLVSDFDEGGMNSDSSSQEFINEGCSNVGVKNFLESGISVQVIFQDKNGAKVSDHIVHPKDCV